MTGTSSFGAKLTFANSLTVTDTGITVDGGEVSADDVVASGNCPIGTGTGVTAGSVDCDGTLDITGDLVVSSGGVSCTSVTANGKINVISGTVDMTGAVTTPGVTASAVTVANGGLVVNPATTVTGSMSTTGTITAETHTTVATTGLYVNTMDVYGRVQADDVETFNSNTVCQGDMTVNAASGNYNIGSTSHTSDRRLKKDIVSMPTADALSRIERLSGVLYHWNSTAWSSRQGFSRPDSHEHVGVIAQELQAVLPEAVVEKVNAEGVPTLYVDYSSVVALLIAAEKEMDVITKDCMVLSPDEQALVKQIDVLRSTCAAQLERIETQSLILPRLRQDRAALEARRDELLMRKQVLTHANSAR